jgi:tetratricopeptide (TPR) repeat protein
MTDRVASLLLALLLSAGFGLATWLQPRSLAWRGQRAQAGSLLQVLLGDGRRMFANHFFTKADVYLHSGYYPSLFDQAKLNCEGQLAGTASAHDPEAEAGKGVHEDDDHGHDFLGKPKDWLDAFGRKFRITEHTHLEGHGTEREILPWLKLSAELDPEQVETYTVAAFWLRTKLGKVQEAEAFLRDGLRANPDSYEILFELGRLLYENRKDAARARNVWELALRKWQKTETAKPEPDKLALERILTSLARLEEHAGNFAKAIEYSSKLKTVSPHPEIIEQQIEELRGYQRQAATNAPASTR